MIDNRYTVRYLRTLQRRHHLPTINRMSSLLQSISTRTPSNISRSNRNRPVRRPNVIRPRLRLILRHLRRVEGNLTARLNTASLLRASLIRPPIYNPPGLIRTLIIRTRRRQTSHRRSQVTRLRGRHTNKINEQFKRQQYGNILLNRRSNRNNRSRSNRGGRYYRYTHVRRQCG